MATALRPWEQLETTLGNQIVQELQCGHGAEAVGTPKAGVISHEHLRFNVATALRPWELDLVVGHPQAGRGFNVATALKGISPSALSSRLVR